jgi:hypothetical protein
MNSNLRLARVLNLLVVMSLTAGLLSASQLAWAQEEKQPTIVNIVGKADVMASGRWRETKIGNRLAAEDVIRLAGGGEVKISSSDDKVKMTRQDEMIIE